jgi:transcription antitermination protein NusB
MSVPIQKFRELVFQLLYSYDLGRSKDEDMLELLSKELSLTRKIVREAQERVHQIRMHLDELDAFISKISHSYAFERIQTVEKNILRLGMYELLFDTSIPHKVVIAEAKRLARKFSTKESASFVHALLDAAYRTHMGEKVNQEELLKSVDQLKEIEKISEEAHEKSEHSIKEPSDE